MRNGSYVRMAVIEGHFDANVSEMEAGFSLVDFPFPENPIYLTTV